MLQITSVYDERSSKHRGAFWDVICEETRENMGERKKKRKPAEHNAIIAIAVSMRMRFILPV